MALQLPRCAECGAPIRSREDETCSYCGAALPWELWDEISNRRIELVEVDTLSFEAAIYRVERSREFAGASLRATRARRRGRPRPPRTDEHGNVVQAASAETALAFVGGFVLMVVVIILTKGRGLSWLIAPAPTAPSSPRSSGASAAAHGSVSGGSEGPPGSGEGASPSPRACWRSAPARARAAPSASEVRTVVLHTLKGEHLVVASEDLAIEAGDVGIATVRGVELAAFQIMSRLRLDAGA